jgi:hypothetical protein
MFFQVAEQTGPVGPKRLIVPEPLNEPMLRLAGNDLEVVEFAECESKFIASVYIPTLKALSADLVYNEATFMWRRNTSLAGWSG